MLVIIPCSTFFLSKHTSLCVLCLDFAINYVQGKVSKIGYKQIHDNKMVLLFDLTINCVLLNRKTFIFQVWTLFIHRLLCK